MVYRALREAGLSARPLRRLVYPRRVRYTLRKLAFRKQAIISMAPADRQFLCEYYRDDVLSLPKLLDRDLTSWLA